MVARDAQEDKKKDCWAPVELLAKAREILQENKDATTKSKLMTLFGSRDNKLMPIFLKFLWSIEEVQSMF